MAATSQRRDVRFSTGPRGLRSARRGPAAGHQHDGIQSSEMRDRASLPRREHRRMDRAGDREGTEKQTEGGELAEDQHPDHGIAGEIFQNSPAGSLSFAIGCRHLLSGSGHRPALEHAP